MLNLLRRVNFPEQLQTSGPLIKASLLRHVSTYHDILREAEDEKQKILNQAKVEAKLISDKARQEAINEVRGDLSKLQSATYEKEYRLQERCTSICTEICRVVVEKFITSASDSSKIRTLVEALLERSHSSRELKLRANPVQIQLLEESLVEVLGKQFNLRKWDIQPDDNLQEFELQISTTNGSEINVSIHNILQMLQHEIEALSVDVSLSLQEIEVGNESHS